MGLEHAQNAGGRVVREIALGDRPPYETSDRQVAAYFALRGRLPDVRWDAATRRPMYAWDPWDEEIDQLRWEYQQPFTLQIEGGPEIRLWLPALKDRIRKLTRSVHGRVFASEKADMEADREEKVRSDGDPAGG